MTILQALDRYYDRMAARGEAELPGYSREKISFAIVLSADGEPIDRIDLQQVNGKKRLSPELKKFRPLSDAPWTSRPISSGTRRLTRSDGPPRQDARTLQEHDKFKTLHLETLAGNNDPGLARSAGF